MKLTVKLSDSACVQFRNQIIVGAVAMMIAVAVFAAVPVFDTAPVTTVDEDDAYSYAIDTSDTDGHTLTITAPTLPAWLTLTDNGDTTASLDGTPTNDEVGDHDVIIDADDGNGNSAQQVFTITVSNTNDAPTITSTPAATVDEDDVYSYSITTSDDDGDAPGLTAPTLPAWLTLTDNGDGTGSLDGTPLNADVGPNSVIIEADDGNGGTVQQSFTITVSNTNDDPTITSSPAATVDEDDVYTYSITTSDDDVGDTPALTAPTLPAWLTITDNGDGTGSLDGTPLNADVGPNSVIIEANDGNGGTVQQSFTITVGNTNDDPTFDTTPVTAIDEDDVYSYSITTSDDDGDIPSITAPTLPLPPWLTITDNGDGTGSLDGTPRNNNNGDNDVILEINDGNGGVVQQVFTITVAPTNDAPTATNLDQTQTYTEGLFSVGITDIVVSDVDTGDEVTATLTLADPDAGVLITTGGAATYTPATGVWTVTGDTTVVNTALQAVAFEPETEHDTDTTIAVLIADGEENGTVSPTGTITLDVDPVNDEPLANNLDQGPHEYIEDDATVALTTISVSDVDTGEAITASLTLAVPAAGAFSTTDGGTHTDATGIWTITGTVAEVNTALSSLTFIPAQDGDVDTTVTTHVEDAAATGPADGTFTLDVTPVNDRPVTPDFDQATDEDTTLTIDLLAFVSDVDNDLSPPWNQPPLDEGLNVDATRGTLGSANVDIIEGTIIYTPFADANGEDTFSYRVSDGELAATGTVTVTVNSINDAPYAANDSASVTPVDDPSVIIDVLDNDVDPDGELDPSSIEIVTVAGELLYGEVVRDLDTGEIEYTLDDVLPDDLPKQDRFTYQVSDDDDTDPQTATATVTVLISPANFLVDSLTDEHDTDISAGNLSLREAIEYIMDGGLIQFDPDLFDTGHQTISLVELEGSLSAELVIAKGLTIRGPGADLLTINGGGLSRVFAIEDGTVTIEDLAISGGAVTDDQGAGVNVGEDATLTLRNCEISGNEVIDDNEEADDEGGGIYNAGSLVLLNCTVSGNTSALDGGGIYTDGTMVATNSTLSGNSATAGDGGGIFAGDSIALITNCTITNNTAIVGGGLSSVQAGATTVNNSIIAGNTATGGPDVQGIVNSNGHNLIGDGEGSEPSFADAETGVNGSSLIETVLRANGGPLLTHALLADSVAIDGGADADVPAGITTDQRGTGFVRIAESAVDIGAYEVRRFVVTTIGDTDDVNDAGEDTTPDLLSLREAIDLTYPGDSISFAVGGPTAQITLNEELFVDSNLAIVGPGTDQLTISGGGSAQILYIPSVDVDAVISGLTFDDGYDNVRGGAVIYSFGTLRMTDCVLQNNEVDGFDGGALHNRGTMTLTRCTLDDNTAENLGGAIINWGGTLNLDTCIFTDNTADQMGGAIFNMLGGDVTITDSSLTGNTAALNGGGTYNSAASSMTISGCTLNNNTASSDAGGMYNAGTLTLSNSTISGNTAGRNGGGLMQAGTSATLTNCTVTGNLADNAGNGFAEGGGICQTGGSLNLKNSIIAGNFDTVDNDGLGNKYPDLAGAVTATGYNIIGDGNGALGIVDGVDGDYVGTSSEPANPVLGLLADNGGATHTHSLGVLSPAIDAGNDDAIVEPVFDGPSYIEQRGEGYPRLVDGDGDGEIHVDIGAVEFTSELPEFTSAAVTEVNEDDLYVYDIVVADADSGDIFTITAEDMPEWLELTDHEDGTATLTGTPTNEDIGPPYRTREFEMELQVADWAGKTDTQDVTIEVTGVNDPPTPADDDVTTDEDVEIEIDVLANDTDPDGSLDTESVEIDEDPEHGEVEVDEDTGVITYAPDSDFNGTDSFSYTVYDLGTPGPELSTTASVNVTVEAVNDAPHTTIDVALTNEDTPITINVLNNDTDIDGDLVPALIVVADAPENGTATVNTETGDITYVPFADFNGVDTFDYRVFDDGSPIPPLSADTAVIITVAPVNDPPLPADDIATTTEDTPVEIDVLLNDIGSDGNLVPASVTVVGNPEHGSTTVDLVTGAITYTPETDYEGGDSFTYRVSDDGTPLPAMSSIATVNVTVQFFNDPPDALDDIAYTMVNEAVAIDVLDNDTDIDGNIVRGSLEIVAYPLNGTAEIEATTGVVTYTPHPDHVGTDSFIYEITDDGSPVPTKSSVATVTIDISGVFGPPIDIYVDGTNIEAGDGSRDNPFQTITSAIAATTAFQSDTIHVMPGVYVQNTRLKPGTNLISVQGAYDTLLTSAGDTDEILIVSDTCVVRGFTIGAAPTCLRVSPEAVAEIANCAFYGCGIGLLSRSGSQVAFDNNIMYGADTAGVLQEDNAALLSLKNNIFLDNGVGVSVIAAIVADGGHNMFFNNGNDYVGRVPFDTDINADPLFVESYTRNFHLQMDSPARDAGDPDDSYLDLDGSINDLGADGGPFGVTDHLPPAPMIATVPSPAIGDPPYSVTFSGAGSTDEWGIATYSWDFDAINGVQDEAMSANIQYTFDLAGTYIVTLTVVDNSGLTNFATTQVTVGSPPDVTATATPAAGAVPFLVDFLTTAIDPDGGDLAYAWDFENDGMTDSTNANSQHTYTLPGGYTPSLIVTDDEEAVTYLTLPITATEWPVYASEQIDGISGGQVAVDNTFGPLRNASIQVPPGAMSGTRIVTIGVATDPPVLDLADACMIAVETGPDGTTFSSNVTVTIPVPASIADERTIYVKHFDETTQSWSAAVVSNTIRVDLESGPAIEFQTNRLGLFAVIVPTDPDIDDNGVTDASDIQLVINRVLGISIEPMNADVNIDGKIDASDIQLTINTILGAQ